MQKELWPRELNLRKINPRKTLKIIGLALPSKGETLGMIGTTNIQIMRVIITLGLLSLKR